MSIDTLTPEEKRMFFELPNLSLEQLLDRQKKTKETYNDINRQVRTEQNEEKARLLRTELWDCADQLEEIEVEIVRQEQKLGEKVICELEEIANEAHRKIRQMENYEWDVVQDSDEENQRGFSNHIGWLEALQSAANLEIQRKIYFSQTNSG